MIGHPNLDPRFNELIEEQSEKGGIVVSELSAGTKLEVQTMNTLYKLEITDPEKGKAIAEGGKLLPEPKEVSVLGCTWGGSMLKVDWIGHQMCLQMFYIRDNETPGCITTSLIQGAKVIGSNFEYEMEWENADGEDQETET